MSKENTNENTNENIVSSDDNVKTVSPSVAEVKKASLDPDMPQLAIDNSVDKRSKEKYIAWCNFTTMKLNDEGQLVSTQIHKGDIITPSEIPQVWIEQAVMQRYLLSKKNKDSLSNDDLRKLGYTVTGKTR